MTMHDDAELVVPFVVVRSKDGPYEDESFCAGVEYGMMREYLDSKRPAVYSPTTRTALLPQVELLAMECSYDLKIDDWPQCPDGWTAITLSPHKEQ